MSDVNRHMQDAELVIDGDKFKIRIEGADFDMMKAACFRMNRRQSKRRFYCADLVVAGVSCAFIGFWAALLLTGLGVLK